MSPAARLYLVEDEALIAMELEDRLHDLGCEVVGHATRGEIALAEIPVLRPDLVLLDVNLGRGLSGIEVARRLEGLSEAPVLFLTAYADATAGPAAALPNVAGTLAKPFHPEALRTLIDRALARPKRPS